MFKSSSQSGWVVGQVSCQPFSDGLQQKCWKAIPFKNKGKPRQNQGTTKGEPMHSNRKAVGRTPVQPFLRWVPEIMIRFESVFTFMWKSICFIKHCIIWVIRPNIFHDSASQLVGPICPYKAFKKGLGPYKAYKGFINRGIKGLIRPLRALSGPYRALKDLMRPLRA